MKYLSVCSGIEAASVAWHPLGWTPVGFSEIEPFPSAVLAHHYPSIPNLGDMTQYENWKIQPKEIDLLVGGTPCQSFSIAGLRQGLKDPRGNLMLTFLAIAEHLKPKWILWENVPGVLSSNSGKDFGCFLGGLGELGYGFAYRILDAQWCRTYGHPRAVPQRRRRVFVVGCFGDATSAAKVLFESESLQRYSPPRSSSRKGIAPNVESGFGVSPRITQCKGSRGGCNIEAISEITAVHQATVFKMQEFGGTTSGERIKNYPYNIAFNDANGRRSDRPNGGAYINATDISTSLTQAHSDIKIISQIMLQPVPTDSASPTLTARMQGSAGWAPYNETAHLVPVLFENHPNDSRITGPHDVAPSCVSRYGTGGGNVPLVQTIAIPAVAYSLDSLSSNSMKSNNPNSGCNIVEVAKCIDTSIPCPSKNQGGIVLAFQSSELRLRGTLTPLDVAPTLKAETKCGDTELKVAMMSTGVDLYNQELTGDIHCPLRTDAGHDAPSALVPVAFGTDCYNGAITGDVAATIGTPGSSVNASGPTVMQTMQVRRLTPTECERLQGFPDGWTAIPWKKKNAEDCPDGPRYKALGNSMAVNCMEWIGERINAVHIKSQNHS